MPGLTLTQRLPDTLASRELLYMPGKDWSYNLKMERKASTKKEATNFQSISLSTWMRH